MARKDSDAAAGLMIVVGIIIYPFIKLYEWMGAFWFWTFVALGVATFIAWLLGAFAPRQRHRTSPAPIQKSTSAIQREDTQKSAIVFETESNGLMEMWVYLRDRAEEAVRLRNPDQIRYYLQKMAYSMAGRDVTESEKEEFRRFVAEFAKVDPLYRDVMDRVRVLVAEKPGLVQSQIYKGQPDSIKEQMRYVLYYAEVLGDLVRKKKGNSYQLFLPEVPSLLPKDESNMLTSSHVAEPIYNFVQMAFAGKDFNAALIKVDADRILERIATGTPLPIKDAMGLPAGERKALQELLTQYVMFLTMFSDLEFPPHFLLGTDDVTLGKPLLEYIAKHQWPFPQQLPWTETA